MVSKELRHLIKSLVKESLEDALAKSTSFIDFAHGDPQHDPTSGVRIKGENQIVAAFLRQLKASGVEIDPGDEKLLRSTLMKVLQQDKKYRDDAVESSPFRGSDKETDLAIPPEDDETPSYYGKPRVTKHLDESSKKKKVR